MSDYLTELRRDLLDAHARYGQRSGASRAARVLHPRVWRPAALATVAIAACLAGLVVAIGALREPSPPAGRLRVAAAVHVGGIPQDAVAGFGSLWIADYRGTVIRVDPLRHRVLQQIPVGGRATSITADRAGVWVTTQADTEHAAQVVRIDPRSDKVTARLPFDTFDAALAAADDSLWVFAEHDETPWLKRVDPASGRVMQTARAAAGSVGIAVTVGGGSVWTVDNRGTIIERDSGSGRTLQRLPGRGDPQTSENGLAADQTGLWVISPASEAIVRIEAGRVARRIPIDPTSGPVLAHSDGALWVTAGTDLRARYRLTRLDRDTGAATATVDLGAHQPKALVPATDGLWVIGADGIAQLVAAGR